MGSGNSKLNPEGEAVPAKLRPFLRRWFDEIRRRKDSNMSKKELLVHQGVEEDASSQPVSQHENERKSMTSTSDESVARSSKVEDEKSNVVHVPAESDKISKEVKERHEDEEKCEKKDEKDLAGKGEGKEEEKEVKVVEKAVVVEEVLVVVQETMEEDDDEEEEEGDEDEKFTFGSPSFRVYCIPSTENNKEESKDESMQRDNSASESVESNSDEGQDQSQEIKNTKKKGNRGRRLKRAIKSGPVAVKNLLNVTSCYHPGCSGNDRARLLAEKAEA